MPYMPKIKLPYGEETNLYASEQQSTSLGDLGRKIMQDDSKETESKYTSPIKSKGILPTEGEERIVRDSAYDPSSIYMDEIHKAASDKNYKALLQSDIAAYNLKMNSQKYLDEALASQGLGSQGYGTSAHVGIENQAQNLYAQNLEAYHEREAQALADAQTRAQTRDQEDQAIAKTEQTELDNQLATFLKYSDGSEDSINSYMTKYGYENRDGNWVNRTTGEPASPYILSVIQSVKESNAAASEGAPDYSNIPAETPTGNTALVFLEDNASTYPGVDPNGYSSVDTLSRAVVGAEDNSKTKELSVIVGDELNKLRSYVSQNGEKAEGTLFKLSRKSGKGEAYLVLYAGGKFYIVSSDDREQAGYPVSEKFDSYRGNKVAL